MNGSQVQDLLMEIFKIGQLPVQEVVVLEKEDKEFVIDLKTGIDSASLIGHRGEVMWALQHIVKNVLKTQNLLEEGEHVKIDVDSYRLKQEENVVSRADQVAKRVLEEGKAIIMPPMSPFFRRLCHMHISKKYPELKTESQGSGNTRAVKVYSDTSHVEEPEHDIYDNLEL